MKRQWHYTVELNKRNCMPTADDLKRVELEAAKVFSDPKSITLTVEPRALDAFTVYFGVKVDIEGE